MRRVDDARTGRDDDVRRRHRARLALRDPQDRLFDVIGERQRQCFEIADDLMDVFNDARNGLVLVDDTVDAEAPDGRAAKRREQHPAHGVAERVAEAALERLEPELGDIGVVFALARFDELRANEPAEIDRSCH
jgi:hypothetical protein